MDNHTHATKALTHGEIVCALDELLLIAGERWRQPVSQHSLARACGLTPTTINRLTPFRTLPSTPSDAQETTPPEPRRQRVALHTVAAICAVLICLPGELLRYRAPGVRLPRLGHGAVRRAEAPRHAIVRIDPVTNRLPELLQPYTAAELARATGLSWATWQRAKSGTEHIDLTTLAAACAVLGCNVDAILLYTIPFTTAVWRIRFVHFDDQQLIFDLSNNVRVSAPLARWPALLQATFSERSAWRLGSDGQTACWDKLGVEIAPRLLLE
jgi:DNA-binding Xre family transcriptional regulator